MTNEIDEFLRKLFEKKYRMEAPDGKDKNTDPGYFERLNLWKVFVTENYNEAWSLLYAKYKHEIE